MSGRPELCCCCCCCPDPDDIPLVIPSTFCTGFSLQGDRTRLRNTGTRETDSKIWKRARVSTSVSGRRAAASWPGVAGPPSDGAEMSSLWSAVHSSDIWNSLWNKHTKASVHLRDLNQRIMEASNHVCAYMTLKHITIQKFGVSRVFFKDFLMFLMLTKAAFILNTII